MKKFLLRTFVYIFSFIIFLAVNFSCTKKSVAEINVYDLKTNLPISGARVSVAAKYNGDDKGENVGTSDGAGHCTITFEMKRNYQYYLFAKTDSTSIHDHIQIKETHFKTDVYLSK